MSAIPTPSALIRVLGALAPCVALAVSSSAQQLVLPATLPVAQSDLNASTPCPLMCQGARLQQFYAASEVGSAQLTARRLALRFDGPGARCATSQHTIQKLTIRIGATARPLASLGADFQGNLTAPLTTAVQAQSYSFVCDGSAMPGPEPWGGPGSQLLFPLASPVTVTIPAGGALALEVVAEGNSNTFSDPALLDFHREPNPNAGFAATSGRGCPTSAGAGGVTLDTSGVYAPGGSITMTGGAYEPNAMVVPLLTALLLAQRLQLPGTTPICWVYVDAGFGVALPARTANAIGELTASGGGSSVPIPHRPSMCGAILYVQNVSPAAVWTGNQLGVVTSNYRTIVVGCEHQPTVQAWHAAHFGDPTASVATVVEHGALALRID